MVQINLSPMHQACRGGCVVTQWRLFDSLCERPVSYTHLDVYKRQVQASHQPKLMPKGSGVPLEVRMHGRKGSERLLRRREEMLARGMPQAKANAATAAELVRWLWALGAMCREATE